MKRLLIIFLTLFLLSGCVSRQPASEAGVMSSRESAAGEESIPEASLEEPAEEPEARPALTPYHQLYDGDNIVEVLHFTGADTSPVLFGLNEDIDRFSADMLEEYAKGGGDTWVELRAYPFTNDRYLQIVATKTICPALGTDGKIQSFNYDLQLDKRVTVQDIMDEKGLTLGMLREKFESAGYLDENCSLEDFSADGFISLPGGDAELLLSGLINNEGSQSWRRIFAYQIGAGTFSYENEGLPFNAVPDSMEPPLSR